MQHCLPCCAQIAVHPLRNDRTVELAPADLVSFVKAWKHEPKVVDFGDDSPEKTTAAAPAKPTKPTKAAAKAASAPSQQDAGRKSGADAKGLEFTKAGNFPRWYEQVRATGVLGWETPQATSACAQHVSLVLLTGNRQIRDD